MSNQIRSYIHATKYIKLVAPNKAEVTQRTVNLIIFYGGCQHVMGGTCFTSFYSSFIQDLHSTGSPGVPLLKAEYTKKRRKKKKLQTGILLVILDN